MILSLETSTDVCSVALHRDGSLLAVQEYYKPRSHARMLAVLIEYIFALTDTSINHLDAVAISRGPGSYTGLRIGVSMAKGLCYASNVPLISINTLEAMVARAKLVNGEWSYYIPMIDARRMEVYTLVADSDSDVILTTEAKVIDGSSFNKYFEEGVVMLFGNGALKCADILTHKNAHFIDYINPSAIYTGILAYTSWNEANFENVSNFEPYYLKDFIGTIQNFKRR